MTTPSTARAATNRKFLSFEELRDSVAGRWEYIFEDLAPSLSEALASAGSNTTPRHVSCPVHGGQDGFRFFGDFRRTGGGICNSCGSFGSGFALLAWVKGYSTKDAVREVGAWARNEEQYVTPEAPRPVAPPPPPPDYAKAAAALARVWKQTEPLVGSIAERYLERRGIWQMNMPASLRFHPRLPYFDKKTRKVAAYYPALIAPLKDIDGRLVSLHRTYLSPDGNKAPVEDVKRIMRAAAPLQGSAIRLWPAGDVVGLAEGLETALAARAIARIPVWSTVSSALLQSIELPRTVRHVVIFADKDRHVRPKDQEHPGEYAAKRAAEKLRAEGRTVEILLPGLELGPEDKSVDWLDVLLRQGVEGFPEHWRRWKP